MPDDDNKDDSLVPASAASPMPAASLDQMSLDDELVNGQRAVIVGAYNSPIEAQMAKSRLESEGMRADLVDEHTVSIGTHLALAVGGVKVRVLEDDAERARELLTSVGEFEMPDFDDEEDDEDESLALTTETESAKSLAARALTTSVVGVIFFPPLNLYSLFLAWRALQHDEALDSLDRRKTWGAVMFDVLGLTWLAILLSALL
jgi:hypothetical protein